MFNLTNYSFNELFSWNNNILQLDATSKLYGQKVDFLHSGTIQILGSVINIDNETKEIKSEEKGARQERLSKADQIEENPILKQL